MTVTQEQVQSLVLGPGVVYVDYNEVTERRLAPTRGGNSFAVEREVRVIEIDGLRGKAKGLRRVVSENATLTVRLIGLSQANLALALPGADFDAGVITSGRGEIPDTAYLKNVTLIAETAGGATKVITLYNALADGNLALNLVDKDEGVVELQMSAHHDPTSESSVIYRVEDVPVVGTRTVTFTVTAGGSPAVGALVLFYGRSLVTNGSGVAVFSGVADGTNRPFEVRFGGYRTFFGSVTVDGAESVNVTLTAI